MDEAWINVSSDGVVVNGGICCSPCMTLYLLPLRRRFRFRVTRCDSQLDCRPVRSLERAAYVPLR